MTEAEGGATEAEGGATEASEGGATEARRHRVYVVLLDRAVLKIRRFFEANPNAAPWTTCLYVGMTGLDPAERFANHKAGHKSSRFVRDFGIRFAPEHYAGLGPMTFEEAVAMEEDLADRLRSAGYAVWQK